MLTNLIGNALRYAPRDSTIEIATRAAREAGRDFVEVVDLRRRSRRARRANAGASSSPTSRSRRSAPAASGLGLAICKRIVEAHGGAIHVEARAAGGCCFVFRLPAATAALARGRVMPAQRPSRAAADPGPTERGRRILVVDDAEGIRTYLANLLELRGFQVDTAEDGRRAMALLDAGANPDVVLMDVMMPGMDGLETLRRDARTLAARCRS